MNLTDALALVYCGWNSEENLELHNQAQAVIHVHVRKLRLARDIKVAQTKLNALTKGNDNGR